jgi:beta-N-acetylhexosaminidase
MRRAVALGLAAAVGASAGVAGAGTPTTAQLVGQKLVVSMDGTTPSASLLRRIRAGRVGGVLIHRSNFHSAAGLRAITRALRRAAAEGGRPRLLVAVDQEGGAVKTVGWIPPTRSPPEMGRIGSSTVARQQGRRTGEALRALGIDTDFAPVADVPASTASFIYRQGRTWSFSAATTSRLANAFGVGLGRGGALATMKHFPGLGFATRNTDTSGVRITASRAALSPGLDPYRRAVEKGLPVVMLSNAVYTAYDRRNAAGWSRAIGATLLRRELGFRGVTITDSLDAPARVRDIATSVLAIHAAKAGTDLLLLTGTEAASQAVYSALLRAASDGRILRSRLVISYDRILALKRSF